MELLPSDKNNMSSQGDNHTLVLPDFEANDDEDCGAEDSPAHHSCFPNTQSSSPMPELRLRALVGRLKQSRKTPSASDESLALSLVRLARLSRLPLPPPVLPVLPSAAPAVEVVSTRDYRKAAKTLQIAFSEDLYAKYLTGPLQLPEARAKMGLMLYEAGVYSTITTGVVLAIRDTEAERTDPDAPFMAVACFLDTLRRGNVMANWFYDAKLKWLCNKGVYTRLYNEQWPLLLNARLEVMGAAADACWYLEDLGTTPAARGKGCARRLLEHMYTKYVDPAHQLCYLESSHPRNRPIYEKLGFTFVKTIYVGNAECPHEDLRICTCEKNLTMDLMVRGDCGAPWTLNKSLLMP